MDHPLSTIKPAPLMIPYLTVSDTVNAIKFYKNAFGFTWNNEQEADQNGHLDHVEMSFLNLSIMFAQQGAFGSHKKTFTSLGIESPITLYLYCENVDKHYNTAIAHGAISLKEPHDAFWGDRVSLLKDPDGYEWMFATKRNAID